MHTPNMDRLAREGVSFTHAFCPGATCVSSRAAIFTGMYAHNTGVYSFDNWARHRNWVQDLAEAGYWCVNIGKMHFMPLDAPGGFHERVMVENPTNLLSASGRADDAWGRFLSFHGLERPNGRNRTDPDWKEKHQCVPWHYEERFHSDVFIGDSALSWIRAHRGKKPLFLQIGFTGPHEPWDPLSRHLELYEKEKMPQPVLREGELADKPPQQEAHKLRTAHADPETLARHGPQGSHESIIDMYTAGPDEVAEMHRHYYAKITTVDEKIGQILDALDEKGYLDDSLVIFTSDHGEMLGDHGMAYKWLMYDSIVNVPLIVWDRRRDVKPRKVDDLVSLMDIGPTVLEAARVPVPTYLEGRSLAPYLNADAGAAEPRQFVFCEDNYQIMMRSKELKLVYYMGQSEGELYDLRNDRDELWNLWDHSEWQEAKSGLLSQLLEWLAGSNYSNAGYKRERSRQYRMRWPRADNPHLHGPF